jgi:hypothetical protein
MPLSESQKAKLLDRCSIEVTHAEQLTRLKKFLQADTYSKLFTGSIESIIRGTLGKKLFGGLASSGIPDPRSIIREITDETTERMQSIKRIQETLTNFSETIDEMTIEDFKDTLVNMGKRSDSRLAWLANTQNYIGNTLESIKVCKSGLKKSLNESLAVMRGDEVLVSLENMSSELEDAGVVNPDKAATEVSQVKTTAEKYPILEFLISPSGAGYNEARSDVR